MVAIINVTNHTSEQNTKLSDDYKNLFGEAGFTLIEIMIVVAIIGVLAAIAYPSYQNYVIKTKRVDAMTELQNVASRIEAQRVTKGGYRQIPLNAIFADGFIASTAKDKYPATGTQLYTITIWEEGGNRMEGTTMSTGNWELRAWPKADAMMADDGRLRLTHDGKKCRKVGSVEKCGMKDEWR